MCDQLLGNLDQLFLGILLETEGHVGRHRILRAAEQAPDRFFVVFAFDVPERDVDGAHCRAPHAGLGARVELFVELVPNALRFQRVFAAQERRQFPVDKFPNSKALRAAGETMAGNAAVGLYGDKDDGRDDFFLQQRYLHRHAMQRRFDVSDLQTPPPEDADES